MEPDGAGGGGALYMPQMMQQQQATGGGGGGTITMDLQNERLVVRSAGREAIRQFLHGQNCFSCLRTSGKVVVFDTRIPIQLAFYALVEHGKQQKRERERIEFG